MKILLGIQPTGRLHIGNYFGALKDIEGYEGKYQVSNDGVVFSKKYRMKNSIKSLKLSDSRGYSIVRLYKDGVRSFLVHRLVAQAFIPNPENKPEVNHINGIKDDNRIENLEWVTAIDNQIHSGKMGNKNDFINNNPTKGKFGKDNVNSKKVIQYLLDGQISGYWDSLSDIQRTLGFEPTNISKCCIGKRKTAYGFIWKFN